MTKLLKQLDYGFTRATRVNWATGNTALPSSSCWPSKRGYQPIATPLSTYQLHAAHDHVRNINWDSGEFILDLTSFNSSLAFAQEYNFALIGCQGVDSSLRTSANSVIQKHMGHLVSNPAMNPGQTQIGHLHVSAATRPAKYDFKLFAGDNAYDFGVTNPMSSYFKQAFGQYYTNSPNFLINGNHDWNFHGSARWTPYNLTHSSLYRAMCQVYHSYIKTDPTYSWHMPYLYYALTSPLVNFICIDSNTFIFDKEQQIWFNDVYHKLKQDNKWLILMSHHPLEYYGPRRNKKTAEWKKYRQKNASKDYNFQEPNIYKFNLDNNEAIPAMNIKTIGAILKRCLEENKYEFDAIFCAHEHAMVQSTVALKFDGEAASRSILQVISGGGGAALNDVGSGHDLDTVIHHSQKLHGYVAVNITADRMTVHNNYVRKIPQSCWPCFSKQPEDLQAFKDNKVTISRDTKKHAPAALQ